MEAVDPLPSLTSSKMDFFDIFVAIMESRTEVNFAILNDVKLNDLDLVTNLNLISVAVELLMRLFLE